MNVNQNFASIEQIRSQMATRQVTGKENKNEEITKSFREVLLDTGNQVKFSKHATQRLQTRNIAMSEEQKQRLQDASRQAREKGMKESLVMVDNLAFIVNVKNNTVITAVNDTERAIFTNIDGAIIN